MKFTDSHEWIHIKEGMGVVGITAYAQQELGEIVYIELPKVGKVVRQGEEVCVLESTKAAADIYAPLSGEIIEINVSLKENVSTLNHSPQKEGWLFKIKLSKPQEEDGLLEESEYLNMIHR